MKKTLFLLFALSISLWAFAQADLCEESDPFCTSDTYVFPAGTSGNSAQPGPNYGCLSTTPNPAWYHMKIGVPGDIEITMYSEPAYDIDFICWGPFSDPVLPCEGQLTAFKTVDCSYAGGTAPEICNIPNGLEGEYYILLITNFSQQECDIIFEKTGGSGETDCGIVPPQSATMVLCA